MNTANMKIYNEYQDSLSYAIEVLKLQFNVLKALTHGSPTMDTINNVIISLEKIKNEIT